MLLSLKSITSRLICILVFSLTVVSLISAAISFRTRQSELLLEQRQKLYATTDRLASSLVIPLWNLDHEQCGEIVNQEFHDEDIRAVLVWQPNDQVFLSRIDPKKPIDHKQLLQRAKIPGTLNCAKEIRKDAAIIGKIEIIYDDASIQRKITAYMRETLFQSIALVAVCALFLYLGIKKLLISPLHSLLATAETVASGNLSVRLAVPTTVELGKISAAFNRITEATEQKIDLLETSFSEIQRLQGFLTTLIDSIPSVIIGVDSMGRVVLWNANACTLSGTSVDAAFGEPVVMLLPQFADELHEALKVVTGNNTYRGERVSFYSGNKRRYFDIVATPLPSGGHGQAVIRIDEITDKVRVGDIMIQTEKMMMIGGLAAGMAHEINNPLGAIMQHAQNIERRVSADLQANNEVAHEIGISLEHIRLYLEKRGILGFINQIREAGSRTASIIENLLKFSRKSNATAEPVHLVAVMDQTLELAANDYDLKKRYDFRHISIIKEYDPTLPEVVVNVAEMEQVFLNIIKNAAQSMADLHQERAPQIVVRLRRDADWAVIDIEDNGPGMSEDVQKRVFEPFYTTKEVGVGTGLGLAVTYSIITTNHNGRISVVSRPGEGACFTIKLPLGRE